MRLNVKTLRKQGRQILSLSQLDFQSCWLNRPSLSRKTVSASPLEILQALPIHDIAFDIQSVLLSCIIGSWSCKCDQIKIFDANEAQQLLNERFSLATSGFVPRSQASLRKFRNSRSATGYPGIMVKQLEESFSLTLQLQQNKITILWKWADTFIWWSEFRVKRMLCKTSVSRRFNEACSQHAVFLGCTQLPRAAIYSFLLRSCSFGRDSLS